MLLHGIYTIYSTITVSLVNFEEEHLFRNVVWGDRIGYDGYLRPDQFLDHLTVIISTRLHFNMYFT